MSYPEVRGKFRLFGAIDFDKDGEYTIYSERLYCCATTFTYPQPSWDMEWNEDYRPPRVEELDYLKASLERQLKLVEEVRAKVLEVKNV